MSNESESWTENRGGHLMTGIEDGALGPCIVVGVAGWDQARMDGLRGGPGIFRYSHQTAGLSCNHRDVCGAFLPLSRCKNATIVNALEEIPSVFDGDYSEAIAGPSLAQISRVSTLLERAGLNCERTFRQIEEAYVTFDFDERTYSWLAQNFEMLTALREDTHYRSEIVNCAPLRWPTKKELLESLLGPSHVIGTGVFLFENSD